MLCMVKMNIISKDTNLMASVKNLKCSSPTGKIWILLISKGPSSQSIKPIMSFKYLLKNFTSSRNSKNHKLTSFYYWHSNYSSQNLLFPSTVIGNHIAFRDRIWKFGKFLEVNYILVQIKRVSDIRHVNVS